MGLGAVRGRCGGKVGAVLKDEVDLFTHSFLFILCTNSLPVLRATGTLSGWPSTTWLSTHQTLMRQAKRVAATLPGSRGNALSRGPMPSFCAAGNVGTRPLPCTVSFCHSRAAAELIGLSVHLSLHFGSTVDTAVDSPVVAGSWKLIRLSVRLSCMVVSPVESPVVAIHAVGRVRCE